jgi:hypothetical protein
LRTTSASKVLVEGQIDWPIFEKSILRDKKNTPSAIALVIPDEDGNLHKIFVPKDPVSIADIQSAMQQAIRKVSEVEVF